MRSGKIVNLAAVACVGLLTAATIPAVAAPSALLLPPSLHLQMASRQIYPDPANAKEDIRQAILKASAEHKRVILDFGGNWCPDCHVLDLYFHDPGNASLLAFNFVLVDVNVGRFDKNLDLARKYGIPLHKGVPALAILNSRGHVIYAQRNGEFESMRKLDSAAVAAFLEKWKPSGHTRAIQKSQKAGG